MISKQRQRRQQRQRRRVRPCCPLYHRAPCAWRRLLLPWSDAVAATGRRGLGAAWCRRRQGCLRLLLAAAGAARACCVTVIIEDAAEAIGLAVRSCRPADGSVGLRSLLGLAPGLSVALQTVDRVAYAAGMPEGTGT